MYLTCIKYQEHTSCQISFQLVKLMPGEKLISNHDARGDALPICVSASIY